MPIPEELWTSRPHGTTDTHAKASGASSLPAGVRAIGKRRAA
jgi:hypothetical protein